MKIISFDWNKQFTFKTKPNEFESRAETIIRNMKRKNDETLRLTSLKEEAII